VKANPGTLSSLRENIEYWGRDYLLPTRERAIWAMTCGVCAPELQPGPGGSECLHESTFYMDDLSVDCVFCNITQVCYDKFVGEAMDMNECKVQVSYGQKLDVQLCFSMVGRGSS